jgi:hypothetical protein
MTWLERSAALALALQLGIVSTLLAQERLSTPEYRKATSSLMCQCGGCSATVYTCAMEHCHSAEPIREEVAERIQKDESVESILKGFLRHARRAPVLETADRGCRRSRNERGRDERVPPHRLTAREDRERAPGPLELTIALLATLGATVVAFVLYPVFAEARAGGLGTLGEVEREILSLEETKSRLYANLADLDFEKESGKVSETDYQKAREDYLGQVAEVLSRLDALAPRKGEKRKPRDPQAGKTCLECSRRSPESAKFCIHCGAAFGPGRAAVCAGCGEELPKDARFCMSCGTKVAS